MSDDSPHISIAAGITVGLVASFVQSLGLTIQRLSHVGNDKLPPSERKADWKRPLWLGGFAIFILSNVFGTLFQIGALPIVVLGPLGAVSLLWNAFFAKIILGDSFSIHLIVARHERETGTFLIAAGAVIIGLFGVVPEQTHTLPELVALYRRAPFVALLALLAASIAVVLLAAHVAEWRMHSVLARLPPGTPRTPLLLQKRRRQAGAGAERRWSAPVLSESEGSPVVRHDGAWTDSPEVHYRSPPAAATGIKQKDYGATLADAQPAKHARFAPPSPTRSKPRPPLSLNLSSTASERAPLLPTSLTNGAGALDSASAEAVLARFERTRVWIAVAYGATSGTLSGLCLLFTKTGIELLILSVMGKNQFGHVEAWLIVAVLLICELFQLSYLNRALRLVGPTLVCPLAFCFYNTTSIASGLIYYRQTDALSPLQGALVGLGVAVLLAGVWVVSVNTGEAKRGEEKWVDEPEEVTDDEGEASTDEDEDPVPFRPRGFSIGLGAASPGFDIRPAAHHHHHPHPHPLRRSQTTGAPPAAPHPHSDALPSRPTFPTFSPDVAAESANPLAASTASLPADLANPPSTPRRRRALHRHERNNSLSGAPYVGPGPGSPGGGRHRRTLSGEVVVPVSSGDDGGRGEMEGLGLRRVEVQPLLQGDGQRGARETDKRGQSRWWKRLRFAHAPSAGAVDE
ncbi:hypothetical protein JCM10207_002296 [Rhodosporidiobolus poonsookiae]